MLRNGTRHPANQQGTAASRMQCVGRIGNACGDLAGRSGAERSATTRERTLRVPTRIREKLATEGIGRRANSTFRIRT
jgi:hypothetical protein